MNARLALVDLLGKVDIVESTRRGRLVTRVEKRSTNTRNDNVVAAVSAVTVVVRQLIRGNAIAHVVLVPHGV